MLPRWPLRRRSSQPQKARALAKLYQQLDFDSFDRVVIERTSNVLGVKADFSWHDVGTWEGLWEAMGGREKNVTVGHVLTLESNGVLAHSSSRLMVLLGVKDHRGGRHPRCAAGDRSRALAGDAQGDRGAEAPRPT